MQYLEYLKIPYKPFGRSFSGCDCIGLVWLFYANTLGITLPELPEYLSGWYKEDPKQILNNYKKYGFKKTNDPQEFDILVLNESGLPKHLGIVLEDSYFLHTTYQGTAIHQYNQGPYFNQIVTTLRYKRQNNGH